MTMKRWLIPAAVAVACVVGGTATAQLRTDFGRFEYENNCQACHGANGRGDGYFAEYLKLPMPDLTTVTQRNGGVFPADRMQRVIDGRLEVKGHGPRQMPVWGAHYNDRAREYFKGTAYDSEAYIRVRVLSLVDYLYSIQTQR
jgi:mono/diheme cytochrome c family protein